MNILITGGTGFLGEYLIRELASEFENIYVLSRKEQSLLFNKFSNVKIVKGDVTHLEILEVEGAERSNLLDSIDVVVHAAALYDLGATFADCFLQNVVGTQNILHFLKGLKNLKSFYYISTIAVGDQESSSLKEDQLPNRHKFHDAYSETKYLAEQFVRNNIEQRYVTRIIRPGIIIGDSVTLEMKKTDGPYYFLEAYRKYAHFLKFTPIAALSFNPKSILPLIPVDHCARFIKLLIKRDSYETQLKTYHLISSENPTIMNFLKDLNNKFNVKTLYIPIRANKINNSLLNILGIPKEVLPFMFSKISYDKTNTLEDLPEIKDSTYSTFKMILFGK